MKRKGYVLTWDSLIALSIVLLVMVGFVRLQYSGKKSAVTFEEVHFNAEDAMETLNKKGVLEEIAFQWSSGNLTEAGNLSQEYLEQILPPYVGYRLEVINGSGVVIIFQSDTDRPGENTAKEKTNAVRFLSGYLENDPKQGWTARAWLLKESRWVEVLACQNLICTPPRQEFNVTYTIGGSNFFYLRVRRGPLLMNASFNVTWYPGASLPTTTTTTGTGTVTTTTITTTTTTSTSTTTTLPCNSCGACGTGTSFYTLEDYYNYHYFDVPPNCDVTVSLIGAPGAQYDLYVNWTKDYCPKADLASDPTKSGPEEFDWIWSPMDSCQPYVTCQPFCNSYMRNGGSDGPAYCSRNSVPPGRYYAMVDCFSYYPDLCGPGKLYTISVVYSGASCVTTTSTTVTTTTVTTTTVTTTTTTSTTVTTTTTTSTTATTTTSTTTTVVLLECSGVKGTSIGANKLQTQNHAVGSTYTLDMNPKDLNPDDIASGCSWGCWENMVTQAPNGCPEDTPGLPNNVKEFNITVYIPSNVDTISFKFVAAPEDGCDSYIGIVRGPQNVNSNWIGWCYINPDGCPAQATPTIWRNCSFSVARSKLQGAGVAFNSDNQLTVVHELVGGFDMVSKYNCFSMQTNQRKDFMHFDIVNITCTYA